MILSNVEGAMFLAGLRWCNILTKPIKGKIWTFNLKNKSKAVVSRV